MRRHTEAMDVAAFGDARRNGRRRRCDVANNARAIISGASRGKAPFLAPPIAIIQTVLHRRVVLATVGGLGTGNGALLAVDTVSGGRLLLSM